ncbi:winged helix-turn-helix transcriptional regulator [Streptomyces sp. SL13]|uniref:Winged helix-turn-helix transcriptional regulator n=1 Tax=Streptantibioticus silvisoli TaxID=2705255 RepID=A0AA90GY11_9ACTN|nr:winged helix-turn-helix transcriptional regulator [Streptantibioticus silvisoli]MDI5969879.1 winged helix-turn-helix transcriptional regulator [Streptantibioticus silvisoli]
MSHGNEAEITAARYSQSIHDLRRLLSGEWTWDVLVSLRSGPLQYTGLLAAIRARSLENGWPGRNHAYLQDSTLNRTLRRLEESELVDRSREEVFPYRTWYSLTPPALRLLEAVVPFIEWADGHPELLERVRRRRNGGDARR